MTAGVGLWLIYMAEPGDRGARRRWWPFPG